MKVTDYDIMRSFFKGRRVGFSSGDTSTFIGTTKGTTSIVMKPAVHNNVEGSAEYEIQFIFKDGTLIGIAVDPSSESDYLESY